MLKFAEVEKRYVQITFGIYCKFLLISRQVFQEKSLNLLDKLYQNSILDISSVKPVDESSVLVKNTGLFVQELDKKAVIYQSAFSLNGCMVKSNLVISLVS